jgi:hypothetical protein
MNRDDLEIRPYRPGDEQRILETFNLVFREVCGPTFVDRTMAHWVWQYLHNPVGHRITVAVAPDGTVASQYAGVPMLADTPWGTQRFVHCVDSMTHPAWRQGLQKQAVFARTGAKYGEQCLVTGEAVCYGFPVDMAYRIGQRYLQYNLLGTVDYLLRDRGVAPLDGVAGVHCERVDVLPRDVGALWTRVRPDKACWLRRDERYLQWRYGDHPERNAYELWAARRGDELCGLMVLRGDQGLVPDATVIVDWLVAENDAAPTTTLLAAAVRRQHELGRQRLLAVFPQWSAEWGAFAAHGFVPTPSATWLQRRLVYTNHLQPMTPDFLATSWWYTLGDSDLA